jgi:hypothetical protein
MLVLLIACANVGQPPDGSGRIALERDGASHVDRRRAPAASFSSVLVESALLAVCRVDRRCRCSLVGGAICRVAPGISGAGAAGAERQLARALASASRLTAVVTIVFGLAPALRASSVKPFGALKVRDDRHGHRWLVRSLIGAQIAFCLFVVFTAGFVRGNPEEPVWPTTGDSSLTISPCSKST